MYPPILQTSQPIKHSLSRILRIMLIPTAGGIAEGSGAYSDEQCLALADPDAHTPE